MPKNRSRLPKMALWIMMGCFFEPSESMYAMSNLHEKIQQSI
jgi:hypothetical protein